MTVSDRLRELVRFYSLSNRAFAIKCGLKQPTFDKQVRGVTMTSAETLVAILNSFPEVSAEWLMRGEGEIVKPEAPPTPDYEKMNRLVDTIAMMQEAINSKDKTIQILKETINQLKS